MRAIVSASLIPLLVAACFGAADPIPPDTGVMVEVSLGPLDPVETEGQPSRTRPAAGARVVARDADGDRAAEGLTDANGVARLSVAPGRYVITIQECPGAMSLPKGDVTVDVEAGRLATAALTCDTGIR